MRNERRSQLGLQVRKIIRFAGVFLVVMASAFTAASVADAARFGESASPGVLKARALVKAYEKPVAWSNPGPRFNARRARGKTVAWISLNATVRTTSWLYGGFNAAMRSAGVKTTFFDGKSRADEQARGIQQAISQHVDAIVLQSIPLSTIAAPIADAKSAGIPVIESFNNDAGKGPSTGATAEVTFCITCVARMMADFVVADSNGSANVLIITSSDVGVSEAATLEIQRELKRLCPSCKAKVDDVPVAQWARELGVLTQSELGRDPSINYILPLYDSETTFIVPAVHAAQAENRVKVVSFNATPGVIDFLARRDVLSAEVGTSQPWEGWAMADQTLRVLAGAKPIKNEKLKFRLFTSRNIKSIDLKANTPEFWYGKVPFRQNYRKLWGLAK